jgi:hypothetical protein
MTFIFNQPTAIKEPEISAINFTPNTFQQQTPILFDQYSFLTLNMGKRQLIKYIYPKNKENKNKLGLILIKKNIMIKSTTNFIIDTSIF